MKTIILTIDESIYNNWSEYAKQAGLPLDSLILEATRFSIKTDRLGVDTARIQELLRLTREAELNQRLKKANVPDTRKSSTPKVDTIPHNSNSDDDLPVANLPHHSDDDHNVNMAILEESVDRHI